MKNNPLLDGISEKDFLEKLKSKKWRHQFMAGAIAKSLAITVRENRKVRGWTQAELGKLVKMSQPVIARLETKSGMERVSVRTLVRLAQAFDCALIIKFEAWGDTGVVPGFVTWVFGFTAEGTVVRKFAMAPNP